MVLIFSAGCGRSDGHCLFSFLLTFGGLLIIVSEYAFMVDSLKLHSLFWKRNIKCNSNLIIMYLHCNGIFMVNLFVSYFHEDCL
jgi:hypothetical protein